MVLGLDPGEAALYVHLSVAGPSKAGDVAAAMRLQRTETYRTLEGLVRHGFATATAERPSRFVAAPVEQVFQQLLAQEQTRGRSLREAQQSIGPALQSLRPAVAAEAPRNTFKLVQGRREAHELLERMVRGATREVFWLDTHPHAGAMARATGTWELAARRAGEGLRVELLLGAPAGGPAEPGPAKVAVRHIAAARAMRFAVVDDREVLLWLSSEPEPTLTADGDGALWSDAADLVGTQRTLFRHLWQSAAGRAEGAPAAPGPAGQSGSPGRR